MLFRSGWFYSSSYKRQLILGNVIVSFLLAIVPFIVLIFESRFIILEYGYTAETLYLNTQLLYWIGGFTFFAFFWTFIREVIKDMEDEKGDREMECHTLPVVFGFKATKIILYTLISLAVIILGYVIFEIVPFEESLSWRFYFCANVFPSIALIYLIAKSKGKYDYRMCAITAKIIMFLGTLYSFIVMYNFQ